MKNISILIFVLCGFTTFSQVEKQTELPSSQTNLLQIEYYWGNGCPKCAKIKPIIKKVKSDYPQVSIIAYEIYGNRNNILRLQKRFRKFDVSFKDQCIPAIFFEDQYFAGDEDIKLHLETAIQQHLAAIRSEG